MRKLLLAATGLVCLIGASYFIGTASGQAGKAVDDVPHRIALIDIGYIFEGYEKVKVMQEDYKKAEEDAAAQAKEKVARIQKKQQELKQYKEDSPDHAKVEQAATSMISEFETFKKITQKDLVKKQAKMFHTAYLEVQDMVEKVCNHHGYTVALRFSREELNAADPNKLMQGLNRPVLFHREEDDISETVLNYLNSRYAKQGGQPSAGTSTRKPSSNPVKPVEARGTPRRPAAADSE